MARLDAVRDATRPKMHGRVMLSGPSGAGKTWTSLSMATRLAADDERPGEILVIDTEKESALTYADTFTFKHLPWRPPYDPDELAEVLGQLGDTYSVVQVDSFSHFWRGPGGTLSIADGKFGGWKNARPVQNRVVEAVLAMPCHVILCVRSKMDYLVTQDSSKKQEITKVGLAPIQDEDLVYEMNVAMDIDLEHRITVTKSRSAAVPVGRMYPAGMEGKAADDYASWLAGGVPPAAREHVDEITAMFASVADAELRKSIKAEFVQTFGMPATLTADKVEDAKAWTANAIDGNVAPPAPDPEQDPAAEKAGDETDASPTDQAPDAADGDLGALEANQAGGSASGAGGRSGSDRGVVQDGPVGENGGKDVPLPDAGSDHQRSGRGESSEPNLDPKAPVVDQRDEVGVGRRTDGGVNLESAGEKVSDHEGFGPSALGAGVAERPSDVHVPSSREVVFNGFRSLAEIIEHVKPMSRATVLAELTALELALAPEDQKETKLDTLRRRLAEEMARRLNLLDDPQPDAGDEGKLGV